MSLPAGARGESEAQIQTQTSPSMPRRRLSWSLLILANVLWACSYVAAKVALRDVSVNLMLALRMGMAALVLLPLLIARHGELKLTRKDLPQLALLALVGFVINKLLEYGGLALTTASDVALLITSESIYTAALSWLLLRVAGVYLIIERSLIPNLPVGGGAWRVVGDLLVVLALIFEALYTVRGKALLVKHSPLLVTAAAIVGSMVFWLPLGSWEVLHSGWPTISLPGWLAIGWMAIMSTAIAYLLWFQGLAKVEGSAAASALFIQPLLGTLLALVLLGDQLTPTTIIGGILIIVSVYAISRQEIV